MNRVVGRIIDDTGKGIEGALVTVHAGKSSFATEGVGEANKRKPAASLSDSTRLGSVPTDHNGEFHLPYESAALEGARPDLAVSVSGFESPGKSATDHVSIVRPRAGTLETFLIKIPAGTLEEVPIAERNPVAAPVAAAGLAAMVSSLAERHALVRSGARATYATRLSEEASSREKLLTDLEPRLCEELSSASQRQKMDIGYVAPGESVQAANAEVVKEGISKISAVERVGCASLTKNTQALFRDKLGRLRRSIPASEFEPAAFGKEGPIRAAGVVRANPLLAFCADEATHRRDCGELLSGQGDADPPTSVPSNGTAEVADKPVTTNVSPLSATSITKAKIPLYVGRLLDGVPFQSGAPLEKRVDSTGIDQLIDAFALRAGPADVPALFDFHQLQIAFAHVWQEALDEGLLELGMSAYSRVVELGGDPGRQLQKGSPFRTIVAEGALAVQTQQPPPEVIQAFQVTQDQWSVLDAEQRASLVSLSLELVGMAGVGRPASFPAALNEATNLARRAMLTVQGNRILAWANDHLAARNSIVVHHAPTDLPSMLSELNRRLHEPYAFTVFGADLKERSINFGLVVTYRQRWTPLSYQAGRMVKSVPLAPKESRKVSSRLVIRKSRSERAVELSLRSARVDDSDTQRLESEVVRKAQNKTNFTLSAEGGVNALLWHVGGSTSFEAEAAEDSAEVKKSFHEAVRKAAEEVKREVTTEVTTQVSDESELAETAEITNPNDELAVTFLFYELQRRYRVTEELHQVLPVVLVAQEVPRPDEIDEDWIVSNDWILRRVILDDSFIPALNYLSTNVVGDEYALEEMRAHVEQIRTVVDSLNLELVAYQQQVGSRYAALEREIESRASSIDAEARDGFFEDVAEFFFGGSTGESEEGARIREEAAKNAYERAAREERDTRNRVEREVTALAAATETYTKALSDHLNRKAQIARLRVHIKENILYYMQAIWDHEPPDQRFFRLHKVEVPDLDGDRTYSLRQDSTLPGSWPNWDQPLISYTVKTKLKKAFGYRPLAEVADLDNPLGYRGNYMIFPLKEGNALTDFLISPYLDGAMGARDPDEFGNWSLDDFADYACCLHQRLPTKEFEELIPALRAHYQRLLTARRKTDDEVVLPSNSLFIEALPGAHPLLEDFKLLHRRLDVQRAEAEVRHAELENIRLAARLVAGAYGDPDVDRKIVVETAQQHALIPVGDGE